MNQNKIVKKYAPKSITKTWYIKIVQVRDIT